MRSRLPQQPIVHSDRLRLPAAHYNTIRLALGRLGRPLLRVLGHRGLDLWLDNDVWLCYDRNLHYRPLLAFTGFRPQERESLAAPVPCELLHYHPYGRVVAHSLLEELAGKLTTQLDSHPIDRPRGQLHQLARYRPEG